MKTTILMILIFAQNIFGQESEVDLAAIKILDESCPEVIAENYRKTIFRNINVLPVKKVDPVITVKAVLPRACHLELHDWQLQTALQLGHYGLSYALKPSTISDLTEIQSWHTIGKEQYLQLGKQFERMQNAGVESDEIGEVFSIGMQARLYSDQIEGLSLHYTEARSMGLSHFDALEKSKLLIPDLKKARGITNIRKIALQNSPRAAERTAEPDLNSDALWNTLENSIQANHSASKLPASGSAWDAAKLTATFSEWKGTPYKWGGVTKKGIDCSGFVLKMLASQFPNSSFPRSAHALSELGDEVRVKELTLGDLIFFAASEDPAKITHVGIYMGDGKFAHASSKKGVTLSGLSDKYYTKRFVTARRLF